MSTFNRIAVGLSLYVVCASTWAAARGQTTALKPPPVEPRTTKQAREARERYVLLIDGKLIPGIVTETESEYWIEQRVGTMRFPKKRVEGSFDSIREAYEYRLSQLPEGDSEERMKLALWCLHLKLTDEAGQLLKSVVELNPKNEQAKAMLQCQSSKRQQDLPVAENDPARFAVTRQFARPKQRPTTGGNLSTRLCCTLRSAHGLGVKDLPVIFDLPLPLAIKRTQEFNRIVHPVLQQYCSKCHDGQFTGKFQLVPIRGRADRTADALRANLVATLGLIDPMNPSRSVLLSSTLRPHGPGTKPRPIFLGSNDPAYKILAEWANRLAPPKQGDEVARREAGRDLNESDEVFAVDRNRSGAAQRTQGATASANMPSRARQKTGPDVPVIGQSPSDPQEFLDPVCSVRRDAEAGRTQEFSRLIRQATASRCITKGTFVRDDSQSCCAPRRRR